MSYIRVIPRDLFNEANLLKCYGAIYIELETAGLGSEVALVHEADSDEPFQIEQDEDGGLYIANVRLFAHGRIVSLRRPLNSRQAWPLYASLDDTEVSVFTDDGKFTFDFCEMLRGIEVTA